MSEESKGAWAIVGKIAAVIAIIIGLITIYKNFFTDGPVLRAQGASYPVLYSPNVLERPKTSPESVSLYLPYGLKDADEIAKRISDRIDEDLAYKDLSNSRHSYDDRVVEINISNTGNREAQDLAIEFDTSGYYELRRVGESPKREAFAQVIKLGNVRPNTAISLIVWPHFFSKYNEGDTVKITHTLGAIGVEFATPINGWSAVPYRWPIATLFVIFVAIVCAYSLGGYAAQKKMLTPKVSAENEEPPKEDKAVETPPSA